MSEPIYSEQVERAVLAACVRDPAFCIECRGLPVTEEMFYLAAHRCLWAAIESVTAKGLEADELTLVETLTGRGELEQAGGQQRVLELGDAVDSVAFARSWLTQLQDLHKRRMARRHAMQLEEITREPAEDFPTLQAKIQPMLTEMSALAVEHQHETTADVFDRSIEHYEAWTEGNESRIDRSREIQWGIRDFDEKLGPWNPVVSDFLILVGGDSSWGKSSLARQVATANLYRGKRVLLFLLETSTFNWPAQAASQRAFVNLRQDPEVTRAEKDGPARLERFREEMRRYRDMAAQEQLFVDESLVTVEQIIARTQLIAARTGSVDLIIVDYLQELRTPDRKLRGDQALHENCRDLKALAKEMRCPLLLLSSINTDYNREYGPGKWDYRGSRDITYAADQAYQIWRPAKDANGNEQTELKQNGEPRKNFQQIVNRVKGRDVGTGACWCTFQPRYTLFSGLPPAGKRGRKPHAEDFEEAEAW